MSAADPLVVVVPVDLPRGLQHEQAELLHLDPRVGDHRLHELLPCEQLALGHPRQRALAHHVEGPLHQADGAHRVVDAPAAEAGLGDDEAIPAAAEKVVRRDANVGVADVGMRAVVVAVDGHVAHDLDARRVVGHDEHRHASVGRLVGVGDGQHDEERGEVGVRREPLLAVDDPLVAVGHGAGHELRRVGAALWLGHRVRRHDVVAQQRLEVLLLQISVP